MRAISIRDDIEQVIRELVIAIPEVYLDYDVDLVELVETHNDGNEGREATIYSADIVFVESDETELVIGQALLGTDLVLDVDIFED